MSQEEAGSQKMSSLKEMLYLSVLNPAANNRNPSGSGSNKSEFISISYNSQRYVIQNWTNGFGQ